MRAPWSGRPSSRGPPRPGGPLANDALFQPHVDVRDGRGLATPGDGRGQMCTQEPKSLNDKCQPHGWRSHHGRRGPGLAGPRGPMTSIWPRCLWPLGGGWRLFFVGDVYFGSLGPCRRRPGRCPASQGRAEGPPGLGRRPGRDDRVGRMVSVGLRRWSFHITAS